MYKKTFVAHMLNILNQHNAAGEAEKAKSALLSEWKREGDFLAGVKDTAFRGCGNAAARRKGEDTSPRGCGCDVCVVYGGDCANVMYAEGHSEWHREQRGKKTRLARRLRGWQEVQA